MAVTYTENYGLGKQENYSDAFQMSVITQNMDKLDEVLAAMSAEILADQAKISELEERVAALEGGAENGD